MADVHNIFLNEASGEEIIEALSPDFPYTRSRAFLDAFSVCWHWHKPVEIFLVESGLLEYETPQGTTLFPAGSGGMVNTGVLHTSRVRETSGSTIELLHIFDPSFLYGQMDSRVYKKYFAPILTTPSIELIALNRDNSRHAQVLEKLAATFGLREDEPRYELTLRAVLADIWCDLAAMAPKAEEHPAAASDKIKPMLLFVSEHYSEKIGVPDIAGAGRVSERECYRCFRECVHTTPGEYLRSYRLRVAREMLAAGDESITQISYACGFGNSSFFGKTFLANFGVTPGAYRREWQNRNT